MGEVTMSGSSRIHQVPLDERYSSRSHKSLIPWKMARPNVIVLIICRHLLSTALGHDALAIYCHLCCSAQSELVYSTSNTLPLIMLKVVTNAMTDTDWWQTLSQCTTLTVYYSCISFDIMAVMSNMNYCGDVWMAILYVT